MDRKRKESDGLVDGHVAKKQALESDVVFPLSYPVPSLHEHIDKLTGLDEDADNASEDDRGRESEGDDVLYATPNTVLSPTASVASTKSRAPSDRKTLPCPFDGCDKMFNRPVRLATHIRSHNKERPYHCHYAGCDKTYIEDKHLKQHIKGFHENERSFRCQYPGCDKAFLTSTRLRRHQLVHEGAERFQCRDYPPCNRSFRRRHTLQRHVRADHLRLPAYTCAETGCTAAFDSSGALRNHRNREHAPPRYFCDECTVTVEEDAEAEGHETDEDDDDDKKTEGKTVVLRKLGFATLTLLQTHLRTQHMNCAFCDFKCASRQTLDHHVEILHGGGGGQSKRFFAAPAAASTTTSHAPPKAPSATPITSSAAAAGTPLTTLVACSWPGCTKTFSKPSNLRAHVQAAHEGVRYVCGQADVDVEAAFLHGWRPEAGCAQSFTTKAGLERHIRHIHLCQARPERSQTKSLLDQALDLMDTAQAVPGTITTTAAAAAAAGTSMADDVLATATHDPIFGSNGPAEISNALEYPFPTDQSTFPSHFTFSTTDSEFSRFPDDISNPQLPGDALSLPFDYMTAPAAPTNLMTNMSMNGTINGTINMISTVGRKNDVTPIGDSTVDSTVNTAAIETEKADRLDGTPSHRDDGTFRDQGPSDEHQASREPALFYPDVDEAVDLCFQAFRDDLPLSEFLGLGGGGGAFDAVDTQPAVGALKAQVRAQDCHDDHHHVQDPDDQSGRNSHSHSHNNGHCASIDPSLADAFWDAGLVDTGLLESTYAHPK